MIRRVAVLIAVLAGASSAGAGELVLFTRGVMTDIRETDGPGTGRVVKKIDLLALRGEFESFSLGVRSSEAGRWKVGVSDLKSSEGGGRVIPASAVEVARLRYGKTAGRGHKVTDWVVEPGLKELELRPGRTARVWLTVHVPEEAAGGIYAGSLSLSGPDGAESKVPVSVEVLPAKLEPVPGASFCLLFTHAFGQYHNAKSRKERRPQALKFYRELKDHGMTCIAPHCSDWSGGRLKSTGSGYNPGHFEGLEACIDAAMEVGLDGPVVWYMSSLVTGTKGGKHFHYYDGKCDNWNEKRDLANLRELVKEVKRREKEKGWPEVVFVTVDEPGTMTDDLAMRRLRLGTILTKTLKTVSELGARGGTTMSEPVDDKHNRWRCKEPDELRKLWDESRPYCHFRIYGYGYCQGKTSLAAEKADCEKRGHKMWFYNNSASMGKNRWCARMYFGLWGWRAGADGVTSWTYPAGRTVQMEAIREGTDDWKYVALIEKLLKEKRGSEADRTEAGKFLEDLRDSVKLDRNGFIGDWENVATAGIGKVSATKLGTDWDAVDFTAFRRAAGSLIKKLSAGNAPLLR